MILLAHFLANFVNNPYGIIPFLEWDNIVLFGNLHTISLKTVFMLTLKYDTWPLNVGNDYCVKYSFLKPLTTVMTS